MNEKLNLLCPVPVSQRPIQEYKSFKSSWEINWTTQSLRLYRESFLKLFTFAFLVSFFLVYNSNYQLLSYVKCLEYSLLFSGIILLLIFVRLYLAWKYIYDRLMISTVTYEESGWYDGRAICCLKFYR